MNENWASESTTPDSSKPFNAQNKENMGQANSQARLDAAISQVDKDMLKVDIFGALDCMI